MNPDDLFSDYERIKSYDHTWNTTKVVVKSRPGSGTTAKPKVTVETKQNIKSDLEHRINQAEKKVTEVIATLEGYDTPVETLDEHFKKVTKEEERLSKEHQERLNQILANQNDLYHRYSKNMRMFSEYETIQTDNTAGSNHTQVKTSVSSQPTPNNQKSLWQKIFGN